MKEIKSDKVDRVDDINKAVAGPFAYITNKDDNSVTPINITDNSVKEPIKVGKWPYGIAVSPDRTRVYVVNMEGNDSVTVKDGTVSVIDTAENKVIDTYTVQKSARGIAISPDGSKVYVANWVSNTVSIIDTKTRDNIPLDLGDGPYGVAVSPDGSKVYVTNNGTNGTVYVIDTASKMYTGKFYPVGENPRGIAVSPDGSKVYVANEKSDYISVIDIVKERAYPINIGKFYCHYGIAVSPDGEKVYATGFENKQKSIVSVIDAASDSYTGKSYSVGEGPYGISVTPDGKYVYVVNSASNTVSVIDTEKEVVINPPLSVGSVPMSFGQFIDPSFADFIGFQPTTSRIVYFKDQSRGNPTSWLWDFGVTGSHPSTKKNPHFTYKNAGKYTVKLTVKNADGDISVISKTIDVKGGIVPPTGD